MNFHEMEASRIASGVRCGEFRAVDVISDCIERINLLEPSLNALITPLEENALAAASDVDTSVISGKDPGLLCGVPVVVKDNMCVIKQQKRA